MSSSWLVLIKAIHWYWVFRAQKLFYVVLYIVHSIKIPWFPLEQCLGLLTRMADFWLNGRSQSEPLKPSVLESTYVSLRALLVQSDNSRSRQAETARIMIVNLHRFNIRHCLSEIRFIICILSPIMKIIAAQSLTGIIKPFLWQENVLWSSWGRT